MDKSIIKAWLLNKKTGVYSVIVETYREQAAALKPSLFIDWLARELDVKTDQISPSGIASAIKRQRKFEAAKPKAAKPAKQPERAKGKENEDFNTEVQEFPGFK